MPQKWYFIWILLDEKELTGEWWWDRSSRQRRNLIGSYIWKLGSHLKHGFWFTPLVSSLNHYLSFLVCSIHLVTYVTSNSSCSCFNIIKSKYCWFVFWNGHGFVHLLLWQEIMLTGLLLSKFLPSVWVSLLLGKKYDFTIKKILIHAILISIISDNTHGINTSLKRKISVLDEQRLRDKLFSERQTVQSTFVQNVFLMWMLKKEKIIGTLSVSMHIK